MRARDLILAAGIAALAFVATTALAGTGRSVAAAADGPAEQRLDPATRAFLDDVQRRTFEFFRDHTDPHTGLSPDRWPTPSFSSVAASGFALTAWPIGVERGWMTHRDARDRTLNALEYFWRAPQDSGRSGATGWKGFFYHFLHPSSGTRFETVELSTIDTALLLGGVLFAQSYFDGGHAKERRIRALADSLVLRVDWRWAQVRPPTVSLGWSPEEGMLPYDWRGYNESLILQVLALGSPTHAIDAGSMREWRAPFRWGRYLPAEEYREPVPEHVGFGPLYPHQYSHVWLDLRGIQDSLMRARSTDYFENSTYAVLDQRMYARKNPGGFRGYGEDMWGLAAGDGPLDSTLVVDGRERTFRTYAARGASFAEIVDDGTLAPVAVGGSVPFDPHACIETMRRLKSTYGADLYGRYGFVDAFNPTLTAAVPTRHGRVVPGVGWFDTDYLGIDQGPILAMIENYRSELIWRTLRRNPHVVRGLRAAGFSGGWLDRHQGGTR